MAAQAFLALGGVVLCVTGAEALYADRGHFGAGADPLHLVLDRAARGAPVLPGPGRADPRPSPGRDQSVLPAGPEEPAHPDGGAGHGGHDHRVAGGDHGIVLGGASGGSARLPPAVADPPHLLAGGPDLRTVDQLGPGRRGGRAGAGVQALREAGGHLRRRGHGYVRAQHYSVPCRCAGAVEDSEVETGPPRRSVLDRRGFVLQRQRVEGRERRLVAVGGWAGVRVPDDHLAEGPGDRDREPDKGGGTAARVPGASAHGRSADQPCARARRSS